jgi:hypothetical protein
MVTFCLFILLISGKLLQFLLDLSFGNHSYALVAFFVFWLIVGDLCDYMAITNVCTCPRCVSAARRVRIGFWRRLFSGGKAYYRCYNCGHRFWAKG